MPKPRVVAEMKKDPTQVRPPSGASIHPHEWLTMDSKLLYDAAGGSENPFRLFMCPKAERKIREHSANEAIRRLEVMGFLIGEVWSWKGFAYSVARDAVTTELESSQAKVRFDHKAFPKLFLELDSSGFDYVIVGWYHSHPGHTCFLSRKDLETQRTIFNEPYHCALVIDPLNREIKAFGLSEVGYEELPFAMMSDSHAFDEKTRKGRTRRLKVQPAAKM